MQEKNHTLVSGKDHEIWLSGNFFKMFTRPRLFTALNG